MAKVECKGTPYRNAFERFEFQNTRKIRDLQERINIELQGRNLGPSINVSEVFDPPTREAIKRIQAALGEKTTGEMRPELNVKIGIQ